MGKLLSPTVKWGAFLLAVSSVLSRLLGVVRDYLFSKIFGIGEQGGIYALDAYFAAFRIPDFLYMLLIMGALSTAFIPLYSRLKTRSEAQASHFTSQVLNGIVFVFIGLGLLMMVFTPLFIPLIAPGLPEESKEIATDLTRIMLLSPLFLGVSSVLQGVENVARRFWGMALAPLVYNLSIIAGVYFFAEKFGVYALAFGVVVGAFLHCLVQIPEVFQSPFRYTFSLPVLSREMKEFLRLSYPRIFALSATQVALLVDTLLASLLSVGTLSIYNYALNLESFPYGVVAISFSVAVFSSLAEQALSKNKEAFLSTIKSSLATILFWALPATVGLFILRVPIVDLILKGGSFDETAATLTVSTFSILIWAALPQCLIPLFIRSFYALSETKLPVRISFFSVIVNIVLSFTFTQIYSFGVQGLAFSHLITSSFYALLLVFFLARKLKRSFFSFLSIPSMLKVLLSVLIMSVTVFFFSRFSYPNLFFELVFLSSTGALIYLLMGTLFGASSKQKILS